MADWTDWPAGMWGADRPVHSGLTRLALQENAQVALDESGYDVDTFLSNDPAKAGYLEDTPGVNFALFSEWYPIPIPAPPAQGGGWRKILIDAELRMEAGAVAATFRFFLHRYPWAPAIDASGLPSGATYVELVANVLAWARYSDTIELPEELTTITLDGGITTPMVWLHCSSKTDVAGKKAFIRSVRVAELP